MATCFGVFRKSTGRSSPVASRPARESVRTMPLERNNPTLRVDGYISNVKSPNFSPRKTDEVMNVE